MKNLFFAFCFLSFAMNMRAAQMEEDEIINRNRAAEQRARLQVLFEEERERSCKDVPPSAERDAKYNLTKGFIPGVLESHHTAQFAYRTLLKQRFCIFREFPADTAKVTYGGKEYTRDCGSSWEVGGFVKPQKKDGAYRTLHEAVVADDADDVRKKLAANVNPDALDEYGDTAAKYAVAFEHFGIFEALVRAGANAKLAGRDTVSAWHLLASKTYFACLKNRIEKEKEDAAAKTKELQEKQEKEKESRELREENDRLKRELEAVKKDSIANKRRALEKKD